MKESLEFSQIEHDDKFKNVGEKVQKLQGKINQMKEELHVIQTAKQSWAIETDGQIGRLGRSLQTK